MCLYRPKLMAICTKIALAYALKDLLKNKPLNKITVSDITDKCGINRQTFYYHFADIMELVGWIIEKEADDALKNNTTYDTWQEGFESLFNMLKEDRDFVLNVYHHIPGDYIDRYLYKVTYDLLYQVVEEKSKDMMVKEEDKCFIANFYKYGFVGLVVEWLNRDMVDDPKMIVSRLNSLIKGSFAQALSNARINH